jgi:hypothetical protein
VFANFSAAAASIRFSALACLVFCLVGARFAPPVFAAEWVGGTGNWSNTFFWDTGFEPGPGEDVWVNAAGGSEINFNVTSATIAELRLGNGENNQVFNIPAGTLTITADSLDTDPSWSGRWSSNTTTRISGTGKLEVSNVGQEEVPYYIAGNEGPGGDQGYLQDAQFIVEGNGQFIVGDGGAPEDTISGSVSVAQWREARATVTVKESGLIDVAGDFYGNSGGWTLNQSGGTINVGNSFWLDTFDAIDGQGAAAEGFANLSGGTMNIGWNFHVVQNGKGAFTVTDQGQLDVDNTLKVNDVWPEATSLDGDGTLNITENGLVKTQFLEVPTSSQLVNDVALLNISGGLLVIENSAVETIVAPSADFNENGIVAGLDFLAWQRGFGTDAGSGNVASVASGNANGDQYVNNEDLAVWEAQYGTSPAGGNVSNPIPDDVASWISSGYLTGSLGTVNRTPPVNIPSVSTMGDIAWGRASVLDGGALYIWTEAIPAVTAVTAVPEPSSLVLVIGLCLGIAGGSRKVRVSNIIF